MHHIYHTEGIILGSRDFGEAGRYYFIFTCDLGMIYASAQGVRKISSKLRCVLQDYSYIKVDLVKGKDFWRITSASKTNILEDIIKDKKKFQIFVNISYLLKRLLAGEDANKTLFIDFLNGLLVLEKSNAKEELHNIEAIIVLRILNNLGYIGGNEKLKNLIKSPFEKDLIFEAAKSRVNILNEINRALRESGL